MGTEFSEGGAVENEKIATWETAEKRSPGYKESPFSVQP